MATVRCCFHGIQQRAVITYDLLEVKGQTQILSIHMQRGLIASAKLVLALALS